jgi:hypothetical protein
VRLKKTLARSQTELILAQQKVPATEAAHKTALLTSANGELTAARAALVEARGLLGLLQEEVTTTEQLVKEAEATVQQQYLAHCEHERQSRVAAFKVEYEASQRAFVEGGGVAKLLALVALDYGWEKLTGSFRQIRLSALPLTFPD